MATPFLGEIKIISWNFPQKGFAFCNGQFLPINQNQALFSLLGTTYGGNGQTTFALPDLRGRVPIHFNTLTLGTKAGEASHNVTLSEMPAHTHFLQSTTEKSLATISPTSNGVIANSAPSELYRTSLSSAGTMLSETITSVGGSQVHENMQPYLVLNFMIALQGFFPSRN